MTRGHRVVAQLLLLPLLYLLSIPDPNGFEVGVGIVLLVSPTVNITVATILVWTARQGPEIVTLIERADDAVTLALMSLGAAAVGAVTILRAAGFSFDGRPVLALLSWVLILLSVPALGWMRTWRAYWLPRSRGT